MCPSTVGVATRVRSRPHAREAATLLPLLQRWQLTQTQLYNQVQRCFELRRRFESGALSVSLRELSLEVAHQSQALIEIHQTMRGQLGCLTLDVASLAR